MIMSLFHNSQGDFQWASIAAILSFIGIIATIGGSIYTNKKSLRVQMNSTTKIEWINKIIELSAEYINEYQLITVDVRNVYAEKVKKSMTTYTNKEDLIIYDPIEAQRQQNNLSRRDTYDKNINKFSELFNERMTKINYKSNQLILYFMDNLKSKDVRNLIDELRNHILSITKYINDDIKENLTDDDLKELTKELNEKLDQLDRLTEEFRKNMSIYLASEVKKIEKQI